MLQDHRKGAKMKTRPFLSLLGFACLLSQAQSQCDLSQNVSGVEFPDIEKYTVDSYIMGVEYSVPGAKQTDYYTEYYETEFQRGRIDGHQAGEKFRYIYRSRTWEAWKLKGNKCELKNITVTPDFFKDDMTDWVHSRGTEQFTTVGPSAMFKVAFDVWKAQGKARNKMAYMGKIDAPVRGEQAVFFRRCLSEDSFVDYFFAGDKEENAFDVDQFKKNFTPLRVAFYNLTGEDKQMAFQYYDIISFQHQIPSGVEPFDLPKGRNCTRGLLVEGPKMPDFSASNLLVSAEVLYRKISIKNDENELLSSYYSTLMFTLDRQLNHIAYRYSSWNTTKPDKEHQQAFLNSPKYIIYDMTHRYAYKVNYGTGRCTIERDDSFSPTYKLPENGGAISLTDPYLLFPNSEFTYLSKGTDRGLTVNVFEAAVEDYILDANTMIKRAFITHSFLTENEKLMSTKSEKNALNQIELHLFRTPDVEEILTFNIYGFTTKLPKKRRLFDISRCFKNEDDYVYLTLGFEPEERFLPELENRLAEVEENVLTLLTAKSELNAVRIPYVMTDLKGGFIFITMLILGKPPLALDFPYVEEGKTIHVDSVDDTQGVSTFDICANNCLETRSGCWGFSLCGATCYYGSAENVKVESKPECNVYRRYTNESFIQSKELQVNNIVNQVESEQVMTMITTESGEKIELKATIAEVTNPSADDDLFQKMGNLLNPRMRVVKSGMMLKKGNAVKRLGKLRYDECQKLCLDFKDCESLSYCLINGACTLSPKFGADLKDEDLVEDDLCNILTRTYVDNFDRTPGVFVIGGGGTNVKVSTAEDCARECLKRTDFQCLSFDHCGGSEDGCRLYSVHYVKSGSGKDLGGKSPRCGHYSRKFSSDFKKREESQVVGGDFQVIFNLTLEECAKRCIEEGNGACVGYDFCQDQSLYHTTCTLLDSDPAKLKTTYKAECNNYLRSSAEYAPRPYSNGYAGGIGFLCFLIGGAVGAVIVFVIAYVRVNRR